MLHNPDGSPYLPPCTEDSWRWFSTSKRIMEEAKEACAPCLMKTECLKIALRVETPASRHGVYGGLTPEERSVFDEAGSLQLIGKE